MHSFISSPVAVPTATGKKLALPLPCSSSMEHSVSSPATDRTCSYDSLCEMKGLRLIDMQDLLASVTWQASCNVCVSGHTVRENLGIRRDLCTKLTLSCTNPLCTGDDAFSDPYLHPKALNFRFILAGRMCGRGNTGLETVCGVMGLPPVSPKSYSAHNSILQKFTHDVSVESCRSASAQLHRLQGADPGDVVDVTVTCDGPWSHRGFVAAYGVVTVLSWETTRYPM